MVGTVATNNAKKCPPNIRTGSVQPPVLVSPISVAHGNAMMGPDASKKGANWMRDQWVANLKKKRLGMGGDGATDGSSGPSGSTPIGPVPTVKAGIRAESSRSSNGKSTSASKPKRTTKAKPNGNQAGAVDKDSLTLMHPAMFFNDLGCFELDSPSFMRRTPTTSDGVASAIASPATSQLKGDSKWMKPLMKRRSSCFAADANSEPKRRTPRRPNPSGSFDDSDHSSVSSPHSYTSVGTPSNLHGADVARMWGPELDFPNGYVDTFLDLPTPKCSDLPGVMYPSPSPSMMKRPEAADHELEQPKLIRTTSIEQEGLSHFFEQTTLSHEGDTSGQYIRPTKVHTPHGYSNAAAGVVDECFGKMAPSPAHHYSFNTTARSVHATPKGTLHVHASSSAYSFEPIKATVSSAGSTTTSSSTSASSPSSEFDNLVQEYEFTDFDQELDSFYLDTIESFGGELDLISN